jgi:PAS domain S-box-containing protein
MTIIVPTPCAASAAADQAELQRLQRENTALRAELKGQAGLAGNEAKFRDLVEAIPQLIWTCNRNGECDYLGPQWVEYTGTPESEQLGYGWLEKLHPEDRDRVNLEWTRSAEAGVPLDVDFRILRADGAYRWFKTRALPLRDAQDQILRWLGTNTDIEDLRQAEQQVRRLQAGLELEVAQRTTELKVVSERLVTATSAAQIGIWDWDVPNDSLVWDAQMYRLYGLSETDFSGAYHAWQSALHPGDAAAATLAIERALAGDAEFDIDFRIVTPIGEVRHIHAVAKVHRDTQGRPERMTGTNWDITREVVAQEQLRATEERWDLALQGTGDGVWDWDLVKGKTFLSRRSRELLGYESDGPAYSEPRWSLVHPDDIAQVKAGMEQHLRGETPVFSCEFRARCLDGTYLWIMSRGRVIARDAGGKPLRVVGTHKDITERRRAQEALEHREGLLREFITHSPAAIAMLDRDVRYIQASRRWLTDYKLDGQELVGRSHYEVFPNIPERWKQVHQRVLAGNAIESCEEDPFPRADGGMDWLNWEVRPWYEGGGEIGGLIFFTQVVTERKVLSLKLQEQNRQLSRSNAELEQFAYVASHDLQEPLRAITGCTQILAQRCKGRLDASTDTLVEHIVDGSARMKALIEGLLRLSRVGAHEHLATDVDTSAVLRDALRNLEPRILKEDAQVSCGPVPQLRGDATQLLQLFQNLIGNALKYRGSERPQVRITAARTAEGHQFSVQDNGIGIEAQYFERIFGVFQRLHTRDEYPGTGIGLAICRKIVERHGGRIWLESTLGSGSTFHFTLLAQ